MFSHLLRNVNFNRLRNFICKFPYSKFLNGNIQCNFSSQDSDTGDGIGEQNKSIPCGECGRDTSGSLIPHKSLKPPKEVSENIFRKFECADEKLGPGADKCGQYQNPEYYGYHSFSYSELLVDILKLQEERKKAAKAAKASCACEAEAVEEAASEEEECAAEEEEPPEVEEEACDDDAPKPTDSDEKKKHNPKCKCKVCKCEVCKCGEKKEEKKDEPCTADSNADDDNKK